MPEPIRNGFRSGFGVVTIPNDTRFQKPIKNYYSLFIIESRSIANVIFSHIKVKNLEK